VKEGLSTGGRVAAAGVATERLKTGGCIIVADAVGKERLPTNGRVALTGGEAEKRIRALSRVASGIAAIRCRANRLRLWGKRKAGEHKRDKKQWSCFELNQWIHGFFLSFPR
jgi:hypothetical protein